MPLPLDPSRVDLTEQELGVRLPSAYRDSMIRANGGAVEAAGETWWLHPIFDDSDLKRQKRTCNDIVRETAEVRDHPGLPQGAVVIAANGSGDHLVLLPGDTSGLLDCRIFRFDHETSAVDSVADSFDALPWSRG